MVVDTKSVEGKVFNHQSIPLTLIFERRKVGYWKMQWDPTPPNQ